MSVEAIPEDTPDYYPSLHEIAQRSRQRRLARKSIDIDTLISDEVEPVPEHLTGSILAAYVQEMYDDGILTAEEKTDCTGMWNILSRCYEWHYLEQITPVHNENTALQEIMWAATGLIAIDEGDKRLGGIPIDVLRESIASGNIQALFRPGSELYIQSMAKFIENLTGIPTELGDFDHTAVENEIAAMTKRHKTLHKMAAEAADQPYKGKHFGGPYKRLFVPVLDEVNNKLTHINPSLDTDALHTGDYQNYQTKALVQSMSESDQVKISEVARWRYNASIEVLRSTYNNDMRQTIPLGLYDQPRITKYGDYRACAAAAFRMIHQGLTGHFVSEDYLRNLIYAHHAHKFVMDEEYLKLFETNAFKDEYDTRVQSLQFMGMNLETLRTIAERKRAQYDDIKMFTVANLATESSKGSGSELSTRIQHRVLVFGADEEHVYVLDPSHPFRPKMDKTQFLIRWAATQNAGYLVIAK